MKKSKFSHFLQKKTVVFLGAMLCCALWGSAYPCVKLSMELFSIGANDTSKQILLAGVRFTLAGVLVVLFGSISSKKLIVPRKNQLTKICKLMIFQTVLQYSTYYIGLAHTSGVNTSIVDSLSYFLSILVAALCFRLEKLTTKKIIGCVLGFLGVVTVNISGGGFSLNMTIIGEGMIFLSAVAYSLSSVLAKVYSTDDDPVLISGYQFIFGGIILAVIGFSFGGRLHFTSIKALLILLYLAFVSSVAFTLWTALLKYNDVSKVSIYGFMNPAFGVFFSYLILNETQAKSLNYIVSLVVVCIAIALVNLKGKAKVYT